MGQATFSWLPILAGLSGFAGALVGTVVSSWTTRTIHRDRVAADQVLAERKIAADISLAERRFEFDKALAQHKVDLDVALAERKFSLDQALTVWRRRFDIAEQVLAATYEVRDALSWARGRVRSSNEGRTRIATEIESPEVKEYRDSAFVPIERLQATSKAFATLQTLQDSVAAHFGPEGAKPISDIFGIRHEITSAVAILMQTAEWNSDRQASASLQPIRDELWGEKAEVATARLAAAVQKLETLLRPVLLVPSPI